ncbi:MAG: PstS family phosphate ABC transporter substrate-binding protein [Pleurocapsa sp.]
MGNLGEKSQKLTSITVGLAVFIALAWTIGLISRGIWQLSQLNQQTAENSQNIPDFARVPNVQAGVFNYGGSTAWASLRLAVDSVIQSERPEIQLRYTQSQNEPPGSNPGIKMLLKGQLAFVQSSQPLSPQDYQLANQQGLKPKQIPVAVDSIAVAVHPQLDIPGLTLNQLQAIYTGKISNWQEVGGTDLPITVYSLPPSTGDLVDIFQTKILQHRQFKPNVKFVPTTTLALRQLANNPGGIYYDSTAAIIAQCSIKLLPLGLARNDLVAPYQQPLIPASECPKRRNRSNFQALRTAQYPLTHYLYVIFLQNQDDSQIGQAYANFLLTSQGQKLITKTGFVPLD